MPSLLAGTDDAEERREQRGGVDAAGPRSSSRLAAPAGCAGRLLAEPMNGDL